MSRYVKRTRPEPTSEEFLALLILLGPLAYVVRWLWRRLIEASSIVVQIFSGGFVAPSATYSPRETPAQGAPGSRTNGGCIDGRVRCRIEHTTQ